MQIFQIVYENNKRYKLILKNKPNSEETLIFEFFGIEKPTIGYEIAIDEKLLDKNYENFSQPYSFELFKKYNDKNIPAIKNENFIVIHKDNKNYIMKRIYG